MGGSGCGFRSISARFQAQAQFATKREVEQRRLAVEDGAREQRDRRVLRAPFAGVICERPAHPGQAALLMAGVALGVGVFILMSALIGGLATLRTLRTVGSIPDIVLEMPDRDPAVLAVPGAAQVVLQKDLSQRDRISIWQPAIPINGETAGATAVSPQIRGSAFVEPGQGVAPAGVIGVMPGKLSAIADIDGAIVDGTASLPPTPFLTVSKKY